MWASGAQQLEPEEILPASTGDGAPIMYIVVDTHGHEWTVCAECAQVCRERCGTGEVGPGCIEYDHINGYPLYEAEDTEFCDICMEPIEPL